MTPLANPRHEAFAQHLSTGQTADAAYEKAGYKPSRSAASRLCANVNVQNRVRALLERRAAQHDITVERLTEMLLDTHSRAMAAGDYTNERLCADSLARLHGLVVDKKHHSGIAPPIPVYVDLVDANA